MEIKKKHIALLSLGFMIMGYSEVSAMEKHEMNDYILSVHPERMVGTERMEEYLKRKGLNITEYKAYLRDLDTYSKSTEYMWERLENGSILIDQILFEDRAVQDEYEKALALMGSDRLAYEFVKKNMINNPDRFITRFEKDMKDLSKIRNAFKKKFKRQLTDMEVIWLDDFSTVKHALYAGINGGELASDDEMMGMDAIMECISDGEGYKLLGLTQKDISTYLDFIKKRQKYDSVLVSYVKGYTMFQSIYTEIMSKYNKDIYVSLTDDERIDVYESSIEGFVFNEKKAKKKVINSLISKGLLSKEDLLVEDEDAGIEQENASGDPWNELENHLRDKESLNIRIQMLSSLYQTNGINNIFENLGENFICFKYKDKDINTHVRLDNNDMLKGVMINRLFEVLNKELGIKNILDKNKTLLFFENRISTFNLSFDEKKGIDFSKIAGMFKEIGVNMYLKPIDYLLEENEEETVKENNNYIYKLIMNFEDKMVTLSLGEEKKIKRYQIQEILEAIGAKSVVTLDSLLVCNNNKIKISKVFGLKDIKISVEDLKTLFDDIDEKVNIQVIKDVE